MAMVKSRNEVAAMEPEVMMGDESIKSRIFTIRGVQVMLDRDLAQLYGVETKRLNEQVRRNEMRFPERYVFQLTKDETDALWSQFATSKRGGSRYCPYVFTEHGVTMVASVLNSPVAIEASVRIVDTFIAMRKALASIAPMLVRLDNVERRQIEDQSRNEERFDRIFKAMDGGEFPPQQVFYEGKHYDAYSFARKLVRRASKSLVLEDGYCDDEILKKIIATSMKICNAYNNFILNKIEN